MDLFVADTHALLWYLADDPSLGRRAKDSFEQAEHGKGVILVPTIVLAECLYVLEKRRIRLDFNEILQRIEDNKNYFIVGLDLDLIRQMTKIGRGLELHDRIILAMAKQWEAKILTRDRNILNLARSIAIW